MARKVLAVFGFFVVWLGFCVLLYKCFGVFVDSSPSDYARGLMSFACSIGVPSVTLGLLYLMKKVGNIQGIF